MKVPKYEYNVFRKIFEEMPGLRYVIDADTITEQEIADQLSNLLTYLNNNPNLRD